MKNILRLLFVLLISQLTGCAAAEPLSPIEYTQLLVNVKEFFALSILLLNQDSPHCIGQAIYRIYYGHYHIARLIYNNKRGYDGNNHTDVWNNMPSSIKSYGEKLKEMRIRYDYGVTEISLEELKSDLEYIKSHQSRFKEMLEELDSTISRRGTNPFFISSFNKAIKEIEFTYESLITTIEERIGNTLP